MKVAIVGLGLIGGSVGLELKKPNSSVASVMGVDGNPDHANLAIECKLVDQVQSLETAIQECDLIILATPVDAILKLLPSVLNQINENQVVMDMGSTKYELSKQIEHHPRRSRYVAAHPMAGTEFSGPKAAHLGLFQDKAAVICDAKHSAPDAIDRAEHLFNHLGMRIIHMDSKAHDLHAAYVSHLSHITSFVLASTVLDKEKDVEAIFNLASGGFESTVRLAKSSPEMWAPIFEQNSEMIATALQAYIERLQSFYLNLTTKNFQATKAQMQHANEIKRVLTQISSTKEK